jgi:tetratricopeptide (TPR) repeat protein
MLGDLRAKLEPIGRLDALDGVGSRVLAYYSKQNAKELTDAALVQRSKALNLMAEVAYMRGNLKEAEGLYRQAMAGSGEAVRRSPDDPERLYEHAQNVFYVGEMARFAGRPTDSEAAWREYKRLADRMAALAPDNLKYRMEVLYANENLGISLYNQHRFSEAGQLFAGAAGPMEKLASLYPDNTTYQVEFATVMAWIADSQRSRGNFALAIDARERQVATLNRLLAKSADSDARSRLITAHAGLGHVLAESGQSERAINELQSAVGEAEDLIPIEPRNAQWKSMAADARLGLALTLLSLERRDEAEQQAAVGCILTAGLPATYAAVRTHLQTICAMIRGRLALAGGDTQKAMSFAKQALMSARAEHSEDPISDQYRIANKYRLIGDVRRRGGDAAGAKVAWSSALSQLPSNVAERPSEINERSEILRRLNRPEQAERLAARLKAIGYRGTG